MEISIVPEIINSQGIKFLDENNILLQICPKSVFKFNYSRFRHPNFIVDNFERGKFIDVEILPIELPQIEKIGYRLVSIEITNRTRINMRNYRGQKKSYMLKRKNDPLEGAVELFRVPKEHRLEMDVVNKRIRIKGRNSYPYIKNENASKWIKVEYD